MCRETPVCVQEFITTSILAPPNQNSEVLKRRVINVIVSGKEQ